MRMLLKEEKTDVSKIKDETGKIWYCVNTDASGNECCITDMKGYEFACISSEYANGRIAVSINLRGNIIGYITAEGLKFLGWALIGDYNSMYQIIEDDDSYSAVMMVNKNIAPQAETLITVFDEDMEIPALAVILAVEVYHRIKERILK